MAVCFADGFGCFAWTFGLCQSLLGARDVRSRKAKTNLAKTKVMRALAKEHKLEVGYKDNYLVRQMRGQSTFYQSLYSSPVS